MSKEMLYMVAVANNQETIKDVRFRLAAHLRHMSTQMSDMVLRIEQGKSVGLNLPDLSEVHQLLGQLNEAEITKKLYDAIEMELE